VSRESPAGDPSHPRTPDLAQAEASSVRTPQEATGEIRVAVRTKRRAIVVRLVFLLVTVIALYILWPSLLSVLQAWPQLLDLNPGWFVAMFLLEVASFVCIWDLQRLALGTSGWFGVATAQLASNAFSRVVPGGAAAGGALQWRMLTDSGVDGTKVATSVTAASFISTGILFVLPVLTVPSVVLGRPVPGGLAQAAWLGGGVFVVGFLLGWRLMTHDSLLRSIGRGVQWLWNRLRRGGSPVTDLPERLVVQRDEIRSILGDTWWRALLAALGNRLFDYLALLAAITAVGSHPRPTLVLLAYSAAMVLAMIPITPGGLGFVEAGLTGLLALAGVSAGDAVLAVLAYRLVSFWLPLPAGGIAAYLHRRRYRGREIADATG
jgi:uncharacterized protein (TIRG00374 family)